MYVMFCEPGPEYPHGDKRIKARVVMPDDKTYFFWMTDHVSQRIRMGTLEILMRDQTGSGGMKYKQPEEDGEYGTQVKW